LQPLSSSYHESGWPRWALFATIPFVLALGLIAGMAVATYTAGGPAIGEPQRAAEGPQQQHSHRSPRPRRNLIPPGRFPPSPI
jgi:hypothetical protein